MKVKDAIRYLNKLEPEANIVIAWWEHDCFSNVAKADWPYAAEEADNMDWSATHSDIAHAIEDALKEES